MLSLFILVCAVAAIGIFLFQLVKAKRSGTLSEYLRDFLVIFLGLLMTAGILYIAIRLIPRIFF